MRRNDQRFSCSALSRIELRSNRARPQLRSAWGQAATELAIVLPVIMLIILGILDFGRAYNYKNDLTSMANQAVRYAEVNSCPACSGQAIETYIPKTADSSELEFGGSGLGIQRPGVSICIFSPPSATSAGAVGQPIEAVVTANYKWIPFLPTGASVTKLQSTATGRIEVAYAPGASTYTLQSSESSCPGT